MKLPKHHSRQKRTELAEALRGLFEVTLKQELATYLCLSHASNCVDDQRKKTLFTWMSEAEKEHLVTLLQIAKKPLDILDNIDDHVDDPAFHEQIKSYEAMDEETIILIAIRNEKAEVDKYEAAKKGTRDQKALKMLDELIREEKEHIFSLEQIYAQLNNRLPSEEDYNKLPPIKILMLP